MEEKEQENLYTKSKLMLSSVYGKCAREPITIPEIEGDPRNGYWYVCSECHGSLNWKQNPCPWCGLEVNWNE